MTITTYATTPAIYNGNGVTTDFSTPFKVLDQTHLRVRLYPAGGGTPVVQTLTTHYTVTLEATSATVSMITPPATGEQLSLDLSIPPTQEVDYTNNNRFDAETTETALDKATLLIQQALASVGLAITVPPGDLAGLELPSAADRANKLLGFGDTGQVALSSAIPQSTVLYTDPPITLVDGTAAYALPAEVQSGLDEDNYRARIIGGGELTRGTDFTVASDTITLTDTPTVATGLAGELMEVELVRPAINGAALLARSVTGAAIALNTVAAENLGFAGQELGDILYHGDAGWELVKAPTTDGLYIPKLTVSSGPAAKVIEWERGGLLNDFSSPAPNAAAVDIVNTITDDDNKLTITQGDEILSRFIAINANTDAITIFASAYASAPDGEVLRMGLFRSTATESIAEDRVDANGKMQKLAIQYQIGSVITGDVTYSLRIGATTGGKLNQGQIGGRKGGGSIAATMLVFEIGAST